MERNEAQPANLVDLLKKYVDIPGTTIGVLGLAFKPDSDDVRESRAAPVIESLLREGANVVAYDPVATDNFRPLFPDITYAKTASEALDTDAVLIVTEWKEFEDLDYRGKTVIDGRRIGKARKDAKVYEGVCW